MRIQFTLSDWLKRHTGWLPDVLAALGLLLVSLLLFSGLLIPLHDLMFRGGDFGQHYTYEVALRSGLAQGELPLWNSYFVEPLIGNPQSEVFYPGLALLRWIPLPFVFIWSFRLHVWLAGLGLYVLLRDLAVRRAAGLFGAIAYMLSATMIEHMVIGHVALVHGMAWIPWVFAAYRRLLVTRQWRYFFLTVLAVASFVLTGHTQWVLIGLLAPAAFGVSRLFEAVGRRDWSGLRATLLVSGLIGISAAGIVAAYGLPTLDYLNQSARAEGLSYENATDFSVEPGQLLTLPEPLARIGLGGAVSVADESLAYAGILTLGLAVLALFSSAAEHRPIVRLLAALDVAALLIALGAGTPVYRLVYALAPFMRVPSRFLLVWAFCTPLLAGIGLESTLRRLDRHNPARVWVLWVNLAAAAVILGIGVGNQMGSLPLRDNLSRLPRLGALELAGLIVILWGVILGLRRLIPPSAWAWLMVAGLLIDLGSFGGVISTAGVVDAPEYYDLYFQPDANPYLGLHVDPAQIRLWGHDWGDPWAVAPAFGIPVITRDIEGSSVYLRNLLDLGRQGALMSAAGFRITDSPDDPPGVHAVTLRQAGKLYLVEAPGNLPRVYATSGVIVRRREDRVVETIADPAFDPSLVTVVFNADGQFDARPFASAAGARYQISLVSYRPNRLEAQITTDRPVMVVVVESYYPGWHATLDGIPTPIWRVNDAFRGIVVTAGTHTIDMTYQPDTFRYGVWISAASLCLMFVPAAWLWVIRRRHDDRRATPPASSPATAA